MRSVIFDTYDTYDDFGLILNSIEIGTPKVKMKKLKIEGADGELDYTDFFGEPKYDNRPIKLKFQLVTLASNFLAAYSKILNLLNGQKFRIVLPDDPEFFYIGRLEVSDLKKKKNQAFVDISCDCEPYKYKANITTVSKVVSGTATITLENLKKRVVPTITTDAEFQFVWDEFSATVAAGTFQIPELELVAGSNTITLVGTGNVTFEYQEGGL